MEVWGTCGVTTLALRFGPEEVQLGVLYSRTTVSVTPRTTSQGFCILWCSVDMEMKEDLETYACNYYLV